MKHFGIDLEEGSSIGNLTVDTGVAYPSDPTAGELFFRTDTDTLAVHDGTSWTAIGGGGISDALTLNGLSSSQFLRSDVTDALTADLLISNDIKLYFDYPGGTDSSLSISATGATRFAYSNSNFIFDAASNSALQIRNSSDVVAFQVNPAAATSLFYNTSAKLVTESTGVDVTGTLNATTALQENSVNLSAKYLGITATAADSQLLDGLNSAEASTGSTVVVRQPAGDIQARLFRSEYDSTNASCNYIMTQVDTISNNYMRPSTPAQFRASVTDASYLGITAKAADSQLLDGVNGASYARSDATDTISGIHVHTNYVRMNDSKYLYFGTSNDVGFFCNGVHMYTNLGSGIGNWYIRDGSTTRFTFNDNGSFTATGNVTAYSDERLKENIEPITDALSKVCQLGGYTYDRNDNDALPRQTGVMAQEVLKVLPEAVSQTVSDGEDNGIYSVAYGNMVGLLIESIKELKDDSDKSIAELKAEIAELKKQIS
jgi:hypothetical protein